MRKDLKHLQTQHDAVMTKLYTILKQKEKDFIALMTKVEEHKAKRQNYWEQKGHLDQERDDLNLELHQKDNITSESNIWKAKKTMQTMRDTQVVILNKMI